MQRRASFLDTVMIVDSFSIICLRASLAFGSRQSSAFQQRGESASSGPEVLGESKAKGLSLSLTTALGAPYKLRKPAFDSSPPSSSSSSSSPTSPPLWAAKFFLFTCLLDKPLGLCIGTRRRKPDWALAEAWLKVLKVHGMSGEGEEEEEEELRDEGLALWTDE